MQKEFNQAIDKIRNEIGKAILKGDFKKILSKESPYTITVAACGSEAEIWNSNEPDTTGLYRLRGDEFTLELGLAHPFKDPTQIRKVLRTLSDEEKEIKQKQLQEKINQLKEELND